MKDLSSNYGKLLKKKREAKKIRTLLIISIILLIAVTGAVIAILLS